ncbi:hypothetical protein VSDG_01288 [Cytospora chrysosperma]|uniref:Uncharacterized protein n=1 Tax=Cytospora chrysosperma TaxID=252740 RepID=A0A423WJ92_CYTCH|nr:hypothetical protein VSDG_01288 [Valsa sordida]
MSDNEGEAARLTLDNTRTPYDEDEVVAFVTELYELLIKLAYLGRDQITWPPDGGHAINENLCCELQIEPGVVSLMKRLPYVDGDFRYSIHLFPRSEPLSAVASSPGGNRERVVTCADACSEADDGDRARQGRIQGGVCQHGAEDVVVEVVETRG